MRSAYSALARCSRTAGPRLAVAVIGLVLLGGCQLPSRRVIGQSVEGRPVECLSLGRGKDVVLIMATIHGDESAGTPLVKRLVDHLTWHSGLLKDRRVVVMPMVNPDGFVHQMRANVNGVDLNRNFPSSNFAAKRKHGAAPLSEPESRLIMTVLDDYRPRRIVSIHQPLACIDYDGPAEGLASAMGRWTDLPVKRLGSRPGSLGSYAGLTRGIPIITPGIARIRQRTRRARPLAEVRQDLADGHSLPRRNRLGPSHKRCIVPREGAAPAEPVGCERFPSL